MWIWSDVDAENLNIIFERQGATIWRQRQMQVQTTLLSKVQTNNQKCENKNHKHEPCLRGQNKQTKHTD